MKRTIVFALAVAALAACSTKEIDIQTTALDDEIFYASFEQPAEEGSRVYANENLLLRWTADDRVSIFNKNTYNQEYQFIGETGDYEGGFNKIGDPEFITGDPIPHIVSVYPYQRLTRVSEEEVITVSLPSEQSYAQNSFGLGANTMVSVSSGNLLKYRNVGGYLMFKLYGGGVSVSSITLKGNNDEKLAGDATVTMPLDGVPTAVITENASTEITLTCPEPVALGATAEESVQFWFVVPPVTFEKGFTIAVNISGGGVFRKSTTKSVVIERNNLSKMAPMEVVIPAEAVDMGLSVKWASFNLGASKPEEYGNYYAWGETEPKDDYSWSTYKWCMGSQTTITKYCSNSEYGYNGFTDTKTVLDLEDDAAHMNLGGNWRMPTNAEWAELMDNCTWTWTDQNGVIGYLVAASNGNSIFLPVAGICHAPSPRGYYWSSSLYTDVPRRACYAYFSSGDVYGDFSNRFVGLSVRPVLNYSDPGPDIWETATAAVKNMGVGWNLGNTLESNSADINNMWIETFTERAPKDYETAWGQPITTRQLIHMFKEAGFNTIRIPVTWYPHMGTLTVNGTSWDKSRWLESTDYQVDRVWMARVKEVVGYVIDEGMYCILNVHHDAGAATTTWLRADQQVYAGARDRYISLWTQIATEFESFGERLVFESFNEMLDATNTWNYASAEADAMINTINADFVTTVRGTGGNNAKRNLILNTYAASTDKRVLQDFQLPQDTVEDHLIAEVHSYAPYNFAFNSSNPKTVFDDSSDKEVREIVDGLNTYLVSRGIPCVIGEFGADTGGETGRADSELAKQAACYVSQAAKYNIACFYWMGLSDGTDRSVPRWTLPEVKDAIISAFNENQND